MKNLLIALLAVGLFAACSEDSETLNESLTADEANPLVAFEVSDAKDGDHKCAAMNYLEQQLKENPGRALGLQKIEQHTQRFIAAKKGGGGNGGGKPGGGGGSDPTPYEGVVSIPVVVHVLYNNSEENISQSQIESQIDVLNAAFDGTDANNNSVPTEFVGVKAGDIEIKFTLADVTRTYTERTSWPYSTTKDYMKKASTGGVDAWNTSEYLNIWVVSQMPYNGGRILGYAQFPGGDADTDGVVMDYNDFGTEGAATAPNHLGKVTVHEVGHWLNLRHIWGDGRCNRDDFVEDTPRSDRANRGCPSYPTVHCRSNDMTMNYMDYTDDACLYMFTKGQTNRMKALFASGGARESFVLP